ncbi:hypothetical protein ABZ816_24470 [Actinosynnema sp. NPDC047251]|uniref:Uncharacterized protein n=1 Tax=Saccharothrix espanaensis (strain ATCC 51144 / DSM 44229 / JCM 9112 / NBRC 15066 / NRRL 15764) TaxID=1179773 RepID=K0K440_SACES|nr:hypothetical protein [Saccharothrix espanaensis]CCH32367.1 hypothetical protein BN6_51010 [Saccharothrix espanaensis DSM 44229]
MTGQQHPAPGSIIVFLNPDAHESSVFIEGVVVGEPLTDPETSRPWVPVLRPGRMLSILDAANIVEARVP